MADVVINIRGTSGSGKTYCVRYVMSKLGVEAVLCKTNNGRRKITGYRLHTGVYVVGSYENECGGCDTIKTSDATCQRVRRYADRGRVVIFEGLVGTSTVYGRWLEFSRELNGTFVWAYLTTPLEMCLERVRLRRLRRGMTKPLDPYQTSSKYHTIVRQRKKAEAAGERVIGLDAVRAPEQLYEMVTKGTLDGREY